MAIVNGFAGLRITEDEIAAAPFLPQGWTGYSFKFLYKGRLFKLTLTEKKLEIETDEELELEMILYGKGYRVKKGKILVNR